MSQTVSRRGFLLASTASLTLPIRSLWADDAQRPELRFLVITDTHLGYRDGESAAQQWEKTAAVLARQTSAFVLHLGDVVDGGREAQYPIYLKTREAIGKPIHEIPGNHDPQPLFEKHIRKPVELAFDHQWLRVVMLGNAHTDSHDGFITREQLEWLDRQVTEAATKSRAVIVAMHVPAHDNKHPDRGWFVKPKDGQTDLYDIVARKNSPVIALFHGHFHNGLRGWDDRGIAESDRKLHEICFPSALYNQDRKLEEQKAAGYNPVEFRPGFAAVTLTASTMKIELHPTGQPSNITHACRL